MRYRKLGRNGPEVSVVALGTWTFAGGSMWGDVAERDSIRTVHAAIDGGVTLIDTAEGYGNGLSEQIVGRALEEMASADRSRVLVASKVGPSNYCEADLVNSCEQSLRRLKRDVIDIYQLHWPRPLPSGATLSGALDVAERLRAQGKVRYIAVCNFGLSDFDSLDGGANGPGPADIVSDQLPYSLLWRAIEHEIVPFLLSRGMGLLTYSTLLYGLLADRFRSAQDVPDGRARTRHFAGTRAEARHGEPGQEALTFKTIDAIREIADDAGLSVADLSLAWALHQPAVASVLTGARKSEQIVANIGAAGIDLSGELVERLDRATGELKSVFGMNPDMWDSPGRIGYTGRPDAT